ncbi:hypothetical protein [Saccharothrix variisporea]|uniref:DUF2269 domain-containing protein n=1 Tax=Saccharothrix variisporea TaxID=543527 RepID=A0A495X380_9PSEU|nr:hypothetical protein [Saccharothrix variisporea]RKT68492.1 hypothetical protein DFJ66_1677 [Saccharothrix variisporea]
MARKLLVWLHVVTSTGWMCMALALFVVVDHALTHPAAFDVALLIDVQVLQFMATTSAFSGLMLAGLTPWGFFRHWWVLVKTAVTFSQLYTGIFVLSPNLHPGGSPTLMRVGSLLMASALAFQVWLSVAKPFGRTPWVKPGKPPTAPARAFLACLAVPAADYALGQFVLGTPVPALSLLTVVVFPVVRALRERRVTRITHPAA